MNSLRYNSFEYQKDIIKIMDCYEEKLQENNKVEGSFGENNFYTGNASTAQL